MSETIICTLKPREILWYLAGGVVMAQGKTKFSGEEFFTEDRR